VEQALHGAAVAKVLEMKASLLPRLGGIFSAFGLLCADIERNYIKPFDRVLERSMLRHEPSVERVDPGGAASAKAQL
jgi:N-methylhydantoinase A/oxoprolinase/acetone carboxylase beta subunit